VPLFVCRAPCGDGGPAGERQVVTRTALMSRQRHFFATAADLRPGLQRFEDAFPVRYAQTGLFDSRAPTEFIAGASLPNLGFAPSGDAVHEPAFLVMTRNCAVVVEEVPQRRGGLKFAVDQLHNPASTVFQPCGLHQDKVLIAGSIATTGATPAALAIHQLMVRTVTKGFRRVQSYWLGPEALALFQAGARLTAAVRRPATYDLRAEGAG
jgi:hypothetical protein